MAVGRGCAESLRICIATSAGTLYETIGGGAGASSDGPGGSAVQVHMTNTCSTDPELLEHRFPLRLRVCALRHGSGGAGLHYGGNGMVREWELLEPAEVSLLASRRSHRPMGIRCCSGKPGADKVFVAGQWEPLKGHRHLPAGARIRIETPGGGGWNPSLSATEV